MLPYYGICVHIDLSQVRRHIGFYKRGCEGLSLYTTLQAVKK